MHTSLRDLSCQYTATYSDWASNCITIFNDSPPIFLLALILVGRAMLLSGVVVNLVMSLLLLPFGVPGEAQVNANTRSPHGNLNIPCQNCHTFSGWKPIRNVPEFDHNQTRYPLRGMHQGVSLHAVPHQTGFYQRGRQVRRLPRRHSQAAIWRGLRTMPHG